MRCSSAVILKLNVDSSKKILKVLKSSMKKLMNMKNDKSTGTDRFTSGLFKFFWKDIGHFLLRTTCYSFEKGKLSVTQKQGIITILPKGNKLRELLKNWRPLSLLNEPYKVLSSDLAIRLKDVLPFVIHVERYNNKILPRMVSKINYVTFIYQLYNLQ